MANRTHTLPGYDAPGPGGKKTKVWEQPGINYTATTGQEIYAAQLGWKFFDHVVGGITESGTYVVTVMHGAVITAGAAVAQHKNGLASVTLRFFAVAGGAEPTADLTGETIRLFAVGG